MGAAQADVLLLPDAMGATHDIIDEIAIDRFISGQLLTARTFLYQVGKAPTNGRKHLRMIVPAAHVR